MSHFKAKMHLIRFQLGLLPRPRWGSLQRSRDPAAGFKGPTSNGKEGKGRKGKEGEVFLRVKDRAPLLICPRAPLLICDATASWGYV